MLCDVWRGYLHHLRSCASSGTGRGSGGKGSCGSSASKSGTCHPYLGAWGAVVEVFAAFLLLTLICFLLYVLPSRSGPFSNEWGFAIAGGIAYIANSWLWIGFVCCAFFRFLGSCWSFVPVLLSVPLLVSCWRCGTAKCDQEPHLHDSAAAAAVKQVAQASCHWQCGCIRHLLLHHLPVLTRGMAHFARHICFIR